MEFPCIDLTKGFPVPEHPPPPGPRREKWTGWEAWDQHCRLVQQHVHLQDIVQHISHIINHYYGLDSEHLGPISLPIIEFPKQPDLENYSFEEIEKWLKDFYHKVLELALPHSSWSGKNEFQRKEADIPPLYHPLRLSKSAFAIRLLEVLPSDTETESLSTRLFNVDLGPSCPSYEALSYRWEETPAVCKDHFIDVNGSNHKVTSNLHSALTSLRHRSKSRILWVDSICINQADVAERYDQVLLMAKIYGDADRVIVYLGPSTQSSATVFKMLQSPICDPTAMKEYQGGENNHTDTEDEQEFTDPAFWKLCQDAGPELIEGFIDVCTRSWWTRIWILQEYTLSKHDPVFYCGRFEAMNQVFSANFRRLFYWVEHRKLHPNLLENCDHPACDKSFDTVTGNGEASLATHGKEKKQELSGDDDFSVNDDPNARRNIIPPQGSPGRQWTAWGQQAWKAKSIMIRRDHCSPFSMSYFSVLGLQSECTNPYDIVYGLRELMDPLFKSIFLPDYTIPLPTLFTRLAAYLIIVERNMDMFWHFPYRLRDGKAQLQRQGVVCDVPSWVPDFSRPHLIQPSYPIPSPGKEKTVFWPQVAHIIDHVLFMDGLLLDEITKVFPVAHNDYFLVLQTLWWVERSFWEPQYLQDLRSESLPSTEDPEGSSDKTIEFPKGITIYPSLGWATDTTCLPADMSIVDVIYELTGLYSSLKETFDGYLTKIPQVVDMIMGKKQGKSGPIHSTESPEKDGGSDHGLQDIQDLSLEDEGTFTTSMPSRDDLIDEMELRFMKFAMHITYPSRLKDLVGISTFDYDNFCCQILEGYKLAWSRSVSDTSGDKQGQKNMDMTFSRGAIAYTEYIDAVDNAPDLLELTLREGFLVDVATKIHKATAGLVGAQGSTVRGRVNVEGVQQDSGIAKKTSRHRIWKFPSDSDNRKARRECEEGNPTPEDISSLGLPHSHWSIEVRKLMYDVHHALRDAVDFLKGRELFMTETGLVGITGVGISGVQDGDDLLLLEGMSFPMIGRLEPLLDGGVIKRRREMPTKMMKREILGTAIVKDVDPKDGNVDKATFPSWFEDISEGSRGLFRFS